MSGRYKHVLANISRLRHNTPAVWTTCNGARSRRVDVIAGEGSLRRMRSVRVRHAWDGPGGLPQNFVKFIPHSPPPNEILGTPLLISPGTSVN